jgi:hypothetical protein
MPEFSAQSGIKTSSPENFHDSHIIRAVRSEMMQSGLPNITHVKLLYTRGSRLQCMEAADPMIGDSLTRHQFLDLVYLIEHEHHPPRFGQPMLLHEETLQPDINGTLKCTHSEDNGNPTCSNVPHFLIERNYGSTSTHNEIDSYAQ